jgi:anti-sigma factor RsiW
MSCDELKEIYEPYALGAAEPDERREIEAHLARHCPNCVAGLQSARRLTASLALAAPPVDPSARLRERVLGTVAPAAEKRSGRTWLTHAWAALAIVMLVGVLWYAYHDEGLEAQIASLNTRLAEARRVEAEMVARNRLLAGALELINLPDSRQLVFGQPDRQPPRAGACGCIHSAASC